MSEPRIFEQHRHLTAAMAELAATTTLTDMVAVLRRTGRAIAGSDGVTIIRRDGESVAYIAEDAINPLWSGKSFAIEACISGLAIIEGKPILIPDIYADHRVPHGAYRPTFVRSMAMYPIGLIAPTMAMGAYWSRAGQIPEGSATLLGTFARMAGVTLARLGATGALSAA